MAVIQVQHGAGRHIGDIPPKDIPTGLMFNFIAQLTYLYAICFCKLAVGASLLRIASTKFWKHLVLGVMLFVFVYTSAGFVVSEFEFQSCGLLAGLFKSRTSTQVQTLT